MNSRVAWAGAACCLVLSCGVNPRSESERSATSRAALIQPPQISPDFPLDQEATPEFNPNASLLSIAASTGAGYLLVYSVPYAPEYWSRFTIHGSLGTAYSTNQLVLMHWDAISGAATRLASLPKPMAGTAFGNARAIEVGTAWLVVYDAPGGRYAISVARDGSLGSPRAVPGTCAMVGFSRATNTALLTDACGNGVLLDLAGQVLKAFAIATPDLFQLFQLLDGCTAISGGQLAFNGLDFLALYYCSSSQVPKGVAGFPISPTGELASFITVAQPGVPYKGVTPLSIAGYNGNFLVTLAQGQSSGPGTAVEYRTIAETAEHAFTVTTGKLLPGESIIPDGQASDRNATALALGGALAIVREQGSGALDLIKLNSAGTGADSTQPLLSALAGAPVARVSSNDPFTAGSRLLVAAGARGVRFDAAAGAIDVPPEVLLSSQHGQFAPSVAFDGQTFLATWTEAIRTAPSWNVGNATQIFGHRLSASGARLGAAGFAISPATSISLESLVVANPGLFSAAWNGWGSWLTGAATITSADPPVVTPYAQQVPSAIEFGIVADGSQAAVAWTSDSVRIAQLTNATTWSTPLTIAPLGNFPVSAPALAFNAGQYAAFWTVVGSAGERVLYGARISAALSLIDTSPKQLQRFPSPILNDLPAINVAAIAAGDHFVIAWADVVGSTEELRVARLSSTLQLLDPVGILVGTQALSSISQTTQRFALDWDGTDVWVVWRDSEGNTRRPYASLRGRRFSEALAPVDSDSFLIANDLDEFSKVTLTRGPGDSSLVGYTRYLADAGSFRVRARFLSASSFAEGVPCGSASQCLGGACVGDYCSTPTGAAGSGNGGNPGTGGGNPGVGGSTVGAGGTGGDVVIPVAGTGGNVEAGGNAGISGSDGTGGSVATGGDAQTAGANEGGESGSGELPSYGGGSAAHGEQAGAAGEAMFAGQAGVGGSPPDSPSCSCRVAGAGSDSKQVPPLVGVLITTGAVLFRRRRRTTPPYLR